MEWPACLDEYEKLVIRMNTPRYSLYPTAYLIAPLSNWTSLTDLSLYRVVIDNAACPTATVVQVDSGRKHGVLLEAVQVLTDLNLSIKKGYISSDGRWFMDVFHVTDQYGCKLTDDSVLSYIEQVQQLILDIQLALILKLAVECSLIVEVFHFFSFSPNWLLRFLFLFVRSGNTFAWEWNELNKYI